MVAILAGHQLWLSTSGQIYADVPYIYAFPIQQLVVRWFQNDISVSMLFMISFFITLPLAILSWKFVEEPALRRWKPTPRTANA